MNKETKIKIAKLWTKFGWGLFITFGAIYTLLLIIAVAYTFWYVFHWWIILLVIIVLFILSFIYANIYLDEQ